MRIATADLPAADRKSAMEQRTAIDLATGIITGQNNCTQEEALGMLLHASKPGTGKSVTSPKGSSRNGRALTNQPRPLPSSTHPFHGR
ncbi:ANTAR domain-containing protein [Paenarthrobacter ureafaciens]|uniref:ANTAR domain-containing protein n=1 Tax=Paenarthrobacter ureafaciens TaxID=37931 RepID=UPI0030B88035